MSENVQEIVKHAMDHTLQNAIYSKEKVNAWYSRYVGLLALIWVGAISCWIRV